MKLYQIMSDQDEEMGLIYTAVPQNIVESIWKRVYANDEPYDSSYMDELEYKLQEENPDRKTERLWIDCNIEP